MDIESTGTDPVQDKIIDIAFVWNNLPTAYHKRFNPGRPIPPEASAVHGIYGSDVVGFSLFNKDDAKRITDMIGKCDLAGYNLRRFDLILLDEELRRVGSKLDLKGVRIIDCQAIYFKKDPRTLSDAVKKYCLREHAGAHGALADAEATLDVFKGQLSAHPDLNEMSIDELAAFSRMGEFEFIDTACKLYRDKDGDARYAFGKNKDRKVKEDKGYAEWMMRNNFPGSTIDALHEELARINNGGVLFDECEPGKVPF